MSVTESRAPGSEQTPPDPLSWFNPATVKGGVAVTTGLVVLLLPGLSVLLVGLAVGAGLLISGLVDLKGAFSRRSGRETGRARFLRLARGLGAVAAVATVAVGHRRPLTFLVLVLGCYLAFRGLVLLVSGLSGRDRERRPARLAGGVTGMAFGTVAVVAPASLTSGLVALGAVGAAVLGAIVLAYGLRAARADTPDYDPADATVADILHSWVRDADIGPTRREELADSLYFEPPGRGGKLMAWWVMLVLSVAIATFAVLQDSTAVVIGAMLVAPLMVPILGLAAALMNGWRTRVLSSALLVAGGVAAAVVLSFVLASWLPMAASFDANSQITSRISPNLLDMLIAVAAGAAGAFATVNVRVAASIAGVAIAVALVPPLAVVGICLSDGRVADAGGAFLLFATNVVSIVLAAAGVFLLTGFVAPTALRDGGRGLALTLAPFVTLALVVLVPLLFTSEGLLATGTQQRAAQGVVAQWLPEPTTLQVTSVTVGRDTVEIALSGAESVPDLAALREALSEELDRPVAVSVALTPVLVTEQGPG